MKFKKLELATWLSLSFGLLAVFVAIFLFPNSFEDKPIDYSLDIVLNLVMIVFLFLIFYMGYVSYNFFKNKNKLLAYNAIFILFQGVYSVFTHIWSIVSPDSYSEFMHNLIVQIPLTLLFGASMLLNGIKLLDQLDLASVKKMRKLSLYFLLITIIVGVVVFATVIIYGIANVGSLVTEASIQTMIDSSLFIKTLEGILIFIVFFIIAIGLPMFIVSFFAQIYLKITKK